VLAFTSILALGLACAQAQAASSSVYLEELSSAEVRALVASGTTTVLLPIGGTEQNGPHMALGKHNARARFLAGQIAQKLGHTLVAPVLAYVPEGSISPPVAHMRFSGTLSIPDAVFEALLESTAKSLKQHGFNDVFFLGDHGGYQRSEARAAQKINQAEKPFRAHALSVYYEATQAPYIALLRSKGFTDHEIGVHAGLADTSMTMAVDKSLVRTDLLAEAAQAGPAAGVVGDPRKASAELGQLGLDLVVKQSVQAIQETLLAASRK
jgi:creatinine amidohydrolase